jgi:TonB family protein
MKTPILFLLLIAVVALSQSFSASDYVDYMEIGIVPTMIDTVYPCYPDSAYRSNIEGAVIVDVIIGEDGSVIEAIIGDARPEGIFEEVSLDAARKCRFEPVRIDGIPKKVRYQIPYVFRKSNYWLRRCKTKREK